MANPPLSNSYETGLPDETNFTAANSGDGAAGNIFDGDNITTSTVKYDTARAAHGTRSVRIDHLASDIPSWYWYPFSPTLTTLYCREYIYRTANPTPDPIWLNTPGQGATPMALIRLKTDGTIDVFDSGLSSAFGMTTPMPLNEWVRIEWKVVCSVTVGIVEAKMFHGDSATVLDSVTLTNGNTGTFIDGTNFGQNTPANPGSSTWIDDCAISTTGYIGPVLGTTVAWLRA